MSTPSCLRSAFTIDWTSYITSVLSDYGETDSRTVLTSVLTDFVVEDPQQILNCLFGAAPSDPVRLAKNILEKIRCRTQDRLDLPPLQTQFLDCLSPVSMEYIPESVPTNVASKEQKKKILKPSAPRQFTERMRRELLNHDLSCGIYQRYGCDNLRCKRCRLIYVTYPVSPCQKMHPNSDACTTCGYFPHVTRKTWEELHAMRNYPPSFVVRGQNLVNPLQRSFLTELGRKMFVKKKNTQPQERVSTPENREPSQEQQAESSMDEDSGGSTVPASETPADSPNPEVTTPKDRTQRKRKKTASSASSTAPSLSLEDCTRMLERASTLRSFDIALSTMFTNLGLDIRPDSQIFFSNNSRDIALPSCGDRRRKV